MTDQKSHPPENEYPRLSLGEINSPIWQKLAKHMKAELERQRVKNDNALLTEAETAKIRGHIECLKGFIAIQNVPPIVDGN